MVEGQSREKAAEGRGRARPKILRVVCRTLSNQHTPSSSPHPPPYLSDPLLSGLAHFISATCCFQNTPGTSHLRVFASAWNALSPDVCMAWLCHILQVLAPMSSSQWHQIKSPPHIHTPTNSYTPVAPSLAFFFRAHLTIWHTKYLTYLL